MKTCSACGKPKGLKSFNRNRTKRDGRQTICRECSRERSRRYFEENRSKHLKVTRESKRAARRRNLERIVAYLRDHPCVGCGEDDVLVLEFDHLEEKTRPVVSMTSEAWERILSEIKKCQVLCASCHARETHRRSNSLRYQIAMGS